MTGFWRGMTSIGFLLLYISPHHALDKINVMEIRPGATVSRYKGRESDIVFFWAIENLLVEEAPDLLYPGLSLAKSKLYLAGKKAIASPVLGVGK
jgi:hypothetical protein